MEKGTPIPESGMSFDFGNSTELPNENQLDLIDQIVESDLANGPLPRFESIRFDNIEKDDNLLRDFFGNDEKF